MTKKKKKDDTERQQRIAVESLERYCGCSISDFCPYILLTNFPRYVQYFAESRGVEVHEGSMFKVAHSPKEGISILDFKLGSPMAALVMDLCAFMQFKAFLMLGMCGGLRRRYKVGDYFVPVGAIRGDGTSDFYFPPEVPALGNFVVNKVTSEVLDEREVRYHIGTTHTTNKRFWEFSDDFREKLLSNRAHVVEMECSTLFLSSYRHKLALGALLLISDLPLEADGVKTKESANFVFDNYTKDHVETGVEILNRVAQWQKVHVRLKYPIDPVEAAEDPVD